jgi:hypothetical protein
MFVVLIILQRKERNIKGRDTWLHSLNRTRDLSYMKHEKSLETALVGVVLGVRHVLASDFF